MTIYVSRVAVKLDTADPGGFAMPIFADNAHSLCDAGFAVIPLAPGDADIGDRAGKKPEARNFVKWRGRPSGTTISKWCKRFPTHNIGYVPGLSGLVVVDDDGGAGDKIIEIFGDTPGRVQARRGQHFLYSARDQELPPITDLRGVGINADIKHGMGIVVAPPSIHRSGHAYTWRDCGPDVLKELPPFPVDRLLALSDSDQPITQAGKKAAAGFRDGSRKLSLGDYLCGHATWCDGLDELLDVAMTWAADQEEKFGIVPLADSEIVSIAQGVWRDLESGKLERWHGRRATVRSNLNEIDQLAAVSKDGTAAFMLLMKLRGEHGARMDKGETFAIAPRAMQKAQTIPHWTRYDYEKARDILLKAGFLVEVSKFSMSSGGRKAAQYRLASSTEPMATA